MPALDYYYCLSTRSRRAFVRLRTRYGKPFQYRPRITLLRRLAAERSVTIAVAREELLKERLAYLEHVYGSLAARAS